MAKFDLSSLTPEAAEFPAPAAHKDNPAVAWLRDSFQSDQARSVKVPASSVRTVCNMLHNAANTLKIGCAVRIEWDGKPHTASKETWEAVKALGNRQVKVLYRGKDRVSRPRKNKAPTAS